MFPDGAGCDQDVHWSRRFFESEVCSIAAGSSSRESLLSDTKVGSLSPVHFDVRIVVVGLSSV